MKFQKFTTFQFRLMNQAGDGGDGGGAADDKKTDGQPGAGGDNKDQKPGAKDQKEEKKEFDISTLPQEAQDLIKSLRGENAKKRTDFNNMKTKLDKYEKVFKSLDPEAAEDEDPEVKLGKVTGYAEKLEVKTAMLEIAYENNVPADQREYFEFLMSKKLESLEEGAEMSEEDLEEILGKVRGKKGAASTSVDDKSQGDKKPGSSDGVTLEQFLAMGMIAKSRLYQTKPEVYAALMKEAKEKKLL